MVKKHLHSILTAILAIITFLIALIGGNGVFDEVLTATPSLVVIPPTATATTQPASTVTLIPPVDVLATYEAELTLTALLATPTQEIVNTPTVTLVTLKADFAYDYAYIRYAPSTSAQIVDKFYPGELRTLVAVSGEWYEVHTASGTGWVASWICTLY